MHELIEDPGHGCLPIPSVSAYHATSPGAVRRPRRERRLTEAEAQRAREAALPDLSAPYALPASCTGEFRARGHTVVRGLASRAEVEAYRPAIVETALAFCRETRPLEARETYFKAFLQITNLWVHDARVRAFVFARRFARVAAELLEVDGVRLYHDLRRSSRSPAAATRRGTRTRTSGPSTPIARSRSGCPSSTSRRRSAR